MLPYPNGALECVPYAPNVNLLLPLSGARSRDKKKKRGQTHIALLSHQYISKCTVHLLISKVVFKTSIDNYNLLRALGKERIILD